MPKLLFSIALLRQWRPSRVTFLVTVAMFYAISAHGQSWPSEVKVGSRCTTRLTGTAALPQTENIVPDTVEELIPFMESNRFNAPKLLNRISSSDLHSIEFVRTDGRSKSGFRTAILNGKKVFLKRIQQAAGYDETFWLVFLNKYDIGIKFLGITLVNNQWVTVLEYFDGMNSKNPLIPSTRQIRQELRQKMYDQILKILSLGINPKDLQFLISEDDIKLIDPEYFKSNLRGATTVEAVLAEFYSARDILRP